MNRRHTCSALASEEKLIKQKKINLDQMMDKLSNDQNYAKTEKALFRSGVFSSSRGIQTQTGYVITKNSVERS